MKYLANGKINLFLKIVGKRGQFHELEMITLPISLCDELEIEEAKMDKIHIDGLNDNNSTVHKALFLSRDRYGLKKGFKINVKKNIPMQSGLGGGSSDAAFVIKHISEAYGSGIDAASFNLANQIGADVPFFLINKPSIVKGIGDVIEPFELNKDYYILLLFPEEGCSTKEVYSLCDSYEHTKNDVKECKKALIDGDEDRLSKLIANDLLPAASKINKTIVPIIEELKKEGLKCVSMSGSGSTVFAISQDKEALIKASENKNICLYRPIICKIIS